MGQDNDRKPDWSGSRIVVVDKDETFRLWTRTVLRRLRAGDVFSTASPVDAYFNLCQLGAHAVLLAVRPGDGAALEFIRKMRDPKNSPDPTLPILAVVRPEERQVLATAADMGIDGAMPKPVKEEAFIGKLGKALVAPRRVVVRKTTRQSVPIPDPPKTVAAPRHAPAQGKARTDVALSDTPAPRPVQGKPKPTAPLSDPPAKPPTKPPAEPKAAQRPDGEAPPPPAPARRTHSDDDWAAALGAQGKTPRRDTPELDLTQVLADHAAWLTSRGADGARADLSNRDISCANLGEADLRNAVLSGADLSDANLAGANLHDADLRRVKLQGADLSDADLGVARLRHADFTLATLKGTNLRGADLSGATLTKATLGEDVEMHGAIMLETDLFDVDLSKVAGLTQAQVARTRCNAGTALPPGLQRALTEIDE